MNFPKSDQVPWGHLRLETHLQRPYLWMQHVATVWAHAHNRHEQTQIFHNMVLQIITELPSVTFYKLDTMKVILVIKTLRQQTDFKLLQKVARWQRENKEIRSV